MTTVGIDSNIFIMLKKNIEKYLLTILHAFTDSNKQIGEAERGSHPWLAMIVLSRKPQSILCYTTIVTPRAAVTAADCVQG